MPLLCLSGQSTLPLVSTALAMFVARRIGYGWTPVIEALIARAHALRVALEEAGAVEGVSFAWVDRQVARQ